jgi:DNA-binding transcriptional LysR family regulator
MNRNDLRRVDMNLLVIFEALMFERNLTRVAEKLFMGQPAISAALARLRDLFDDPLLLRNGRAMEPTARALAILKELQPALDTISGPFPIEPAELSMVWSGVHDNDPAERWLRSRITQFMSQEARPMP